MWLLLMSLMLLLLLEVLWLMTIIRLLLVVSLLLLWLMNTAAGYGWFQIWSSLSKGLTSQGLVPSNHGIYHHSIHCCAKWRWQGRRPGYHGRLAAVQRAFLPFIRLVPGEEEWKVHSSFSSSSFPVPRSWSHGAEECKTRLLLLLTTVHEKEGGTTNGTPSLERNNS
jgi:hypothetical protein